MAPGSSAQVSANPNPNPNPIPNPNPNPNPNPTPGLGPFEPRGVKMVLEHVDVALLNFGLHYHSQLELRAVLRAAFDALVARLGLGLGLGLGKGIRAELGEG